MAENQYGLGQPKLDNSLFYKLYGNPVVTSSTETTGLGNIVEGPSKYNANLMNQSGVNPLTSNVVPETTFGLENKTWGNIGTGLQLGTGLFNAYTGYKQLGLAEDTFNFNKDMAQKEYAMAKDAYDKQVKRASSIGDQMQAGKVS